MATEAKRGLIRVGSNYARLLTTLTFGIATVPLLTRWLGADVLGLYLFLLSQAGVASIFQEVIRTSLVRELAAAWHGKRNFGEICDAAVWVCLGVIVLAICTFGILILILPYLPIAESLQNAARLMLMFECGYTIVNVLWSPANTMYVVREKFILQNMIVGLWRADNIIAVLVCSSIWPNATPGEGLIVFAAMAAGFRVSVISLSGLGMALQERRLFGRPWRAKKSAIKAIMGTFGWNIGPIVAANLHDRAGAFIMNIWFGLFGSAVFGMSTRLVSYIRMVTIGMTIGVDAVSARLVAMDDGGASLRRLLHTVSRMHALMAWPAAVAAFVLADDLLRLWIGSSLEDPERYLEVMAMLVRIAALGLAARAISDGWVLLLFGAGYINRYAKILLSGGLLDPLLAIGLILLLPNLGDEGVVWNNIAGPAWAITATFVIFHGLWLPIRGAKILDVPVSAFLRPTLRPLVLALVLSPALIWPQWVPLMRAPGEAWGLIDLATGMASYGALYGTAAWFLLLSSVERTRFLRVIRGKTGLRDSVDEVEMSD
ncbi:MAG: hypothetical protein HOI89_01145 [Phycisphaerae bacterium]|jgi:O-antigen/teichoic acid export membrane protein|nr:hypothetical protein [Phycisphaerae bacterium]MBT5656378.1 hypothetical protein [Phycisphaerae bacterium]